MKRLLLLALLFAALSANAQFKAPREHATHAPAKQLDPSEVTRAIAAQLRQHGVAPASSGQSRSRGFATQQTLQPSTLAAQAPGIPVPLARKRAVPDVRSVNAYGNRGVQALGAIPVERAVERQLTSMSLPLKHVLQELTVAQVSTDPTGVRHVRMQQQLNGVPVYGGEVILHQPPAGVATATGRVIPTAKGLNLTPALSSADALDRMHAELSPPARYTPGSLAAQLQTTETTPELTVYELDGRSRLTYIGEVSPRLGEHFRVVVDALSGEVIDRWSMRCDVFDHGHAAALPPQGGETARAQDLNGVARTFQTYADQGTFWLIDGTRPMWKNTSKIPDAVVGGIVTIDAQNTSPKSDEFAAVYAQSDGNTWGDASMVSAHYNSEIAYEYFRRTFNRNSIDGAGGNVRAVVNVSDEDGSSLENAFWSNGIMWYGNGGSALSPLAGALDVGGHEMSHGVVQATANLEYEGESGALNEHFADVFAVMIDRDDWQLGEDIVNRRTFRSGALRDFADPNNGGSSLGDAGYQPARYADRYLGSEDNGGVHINSGIVNNVCYRIAQAIGREETEQLYYDVLSNYLTRTSQFIDYRNALQQSGEQRYGAGSTELTAIVSALDAVGIPGSAAGEGGGSGPVTQATNPGDELIAVLDERETLIRVVDAAGRQVIDDITPTYLPSQRPSITDDGSFAIVVTGDSDDNTGGGRLNLIAIDYATNTVSESLLDFDFDEDGEGDVYNAIISRDGSRIAYILKGDFRDDNIWVGDLASGETEGFRLYNQSTDGDRLFNVQYADAMEFDYTGEYLIYDAFSSVKGAQGFEVDSWDISIVHVFDNGTQQFADGSINRLFSALDEGVNIGNPTLAKNSGNILAFDYFDGDDNYEVRTVDILTGDQGTLFAGTKLGYPSYAPDDKTVYISANTTEGDAVIGRVPLEEDKLNRSDDPTAFAADASRSTAYANGERVITSGVAELRAGAPWTVAPNPTADIVRIFRLDGAPPEKEDFELFDARGAMIRLYAPQTREINLDQLPTGTYVLRQGKTSRVLIRN